MNDETFLCNVAHTISLGAGVQSSTMALMAKHGEITPMPDCAIFADTQAEPAKVYEWLDWLEKQLPYPIYRVTAGSLEEKSLKVRKTLDGSHHYIKHNVPAFTANADFSSGKKQRQCTYDFKIVPIYRQVRKLYGKQKVMMWIGISTNEVSRIKPSRVAFVENTWPLIDKRMNREDCKNWMKKNGYPEPPRSSCVFCPYHSNSEWARLTPDELRRAVNYEKGLQSAFEKVERLTSKPYLHQSLKPLETIDFKQPDLFDGKFNNECEGMCGV